MADEPLGDAPLPEWVDPDLLNAEERVVADELCIACRYNLRTLQARQRCPECGLPVLMSLYRQELEYAPADWVRGLVHGAGVLSAAGATVLIGLVLLFLPEMLLTAVSGVLIGVIAPLTGLIGLYKLTAPDPRPPRKPENWTLRRATRWSPAAGVALIGATLVRAPTALPFLGVLCVSGAVLTLLLAHAVMLARRARELRLANLARGLALSVAGLTAAAACASILWFVPHSWGGEGEQILRMLALSLCLVVAGGSTLVFLRMERVLRDQAEQTSARMPPVA